MALRIVVVVRSSRSGLLSAAIGLSPASSHLLQSRMHPLMDAWSLTSSYTLVIGRPLYQRRHNAVIYGELVSICYHVSRLLSQRRVGVATEGKK